MAGLGDSKANSAEIAKLNADVEARKESIKAGYKKAASTAVQAGNEFKAAYDSVKWKKESKTDQAGISDAGTIPGTAATDGSGSKGGAGSASAKKSNEVVATGGTKHNYITITIKELNGLKDVVISGKDAANKAGTEVADELLRILAMATTATG
jgi:hypothetical protein